MLLIVISEENKTKIALNRDEIVFKNYFIDNYNVLKDYAYYFLKDHHLAEDVSSEIMWKLWHMGADLMYISSVENYLLRSIKNRCLNILRVRQTVLMEHDDLNEQLIEHADPEKLLISSQEISKIKEAIDSLPRQTHKAFSLVKESQHTYKEAAEIMGVSVKTIDRHIQIAIKKLWLALKKNK